MITGDYIITQSLLKSKFDGFAKLLLISGLFSCCAFLLMSNLRDFLEEAAVAAVLDAMEVVDIVDFLAGFELGTDCNWPLLALSS